MFIFFYLIFSVYVVTPSNAFLKTQMKKQIAKVFKGNIGI